MSVSDIHKLLNENNADQALKKYKHLDKSKLSKLECIELEGFILSSGKKYQKVLEISSVELHPIDSDVKVRIIINKYNALYGLKRFKEASDKAKILENSKNRKKLKLSNHTIYRLNYALINFYQKQNNFKKAIKYAEENIDLLLIENKDDTGKRLGFVYHKLAILNDYMGNMKNASEYYEKCLKLFAKHPDKYLIMTTHYNLGGILIDRGLIDDAFYHLELSKEIAIEIENETRYGFSILAIGRYYFGKGNILKALEYYEEGLKIFQDSSWEDMFFVYSNFFELYFAINEFNEAKLYYDKIVKLFVNKPLSNYYKLFPRLYKAMLDKNSTVTRQKANAMNIFEQLSNEEIIDHTITYQAIIHYVDMLIDDLAESGDQGVFNEVKRYLEKLEDFAYDQEISHLLAQSYLFSSKIYMIEEKNDEAEKFLKKAKSIASEYGYEYLKSSIESQYEIFSEITIQENNFSSLSLREKIVESKIKQLISLEANTKPKIVMLEEGTPINIALYSSNGTEIYEFQFENDTSQELETLRQTVRNLINFTQQRETMIDKLEHKQYTVIFESSDELILSLIYEGNSHIQKQKLKELKLNLINSIEEVYVSNSNDLNIILPNLIQEIF